MMSFCQETCFFLSWNYGTCFKGNQ
jgi:hypothetical protein